MHQAGERSRNVRIFAGFFYGVRENLQITPHCQGGAENSVRRLLTKTPPVPSVAPCRVEIPRETALSFERFPWPWQKDHPW